MTSFSRACHGAFFLSGVYLAVLYISYLFHHMRCGIYVMIRAGKLRLCAPFVNAKYRNTWSGALKWRVAKPGAQQAPQGGGTVEDMPFGQDVEGYYEAKMVTGYREENVVPNVEEWWANGNIICNEHCPPGQVLGSWGFFIACSK